MISDADLIAGVRSFVPVAMHVTGTPGLTLALGRHGRLLCEEGFGYGDLQRRIPMRQDCVMNVGSISKLYTGVAVMQLFDEGLIELHRPINDYLSGWRIVNPLGEREITAYDLMTFRSGLGNDTMEGDFTQPPPLPDYLQRQYATGRGREYHGHLPRWTAKVGERYQYSTLGIATLGYLVAILNSDGLSFPRYVRKRIFERLGMRSSAFAAGDEDQAILHRLEDRRSKGYAQFARTYIPSPVLHSAAYPGSGLLTTASDHCRLLLALLARGSLDGRSILSPESVQMMLTKQVQGEGIFPDLDASNGLVVQLVNFGKPDFSFGHGGAFPWGWYHDSRAYPADGVALAVFANKWNAIRWQGPSTEIAPSLVAAFVARLLQGDDAMAYPDGNCRSWAWKRSFAMGMLLVERCVGMFGATSKPPAGYIEQMAAGAVALGGDRDPAVGWDPNGFSAGAAAIGKLDMTPAAIRAWVRSGDLPVAHGELDLIALEFGRPRGLPIPMPFFARNAG